MAAAPSAGASLVCIRLAAARQRAPASPDTTFAISGKETLDEPAVLEMMWAPGDPSPPLLYTLQQNCMAGRMCDVAGVAALQDVI